MTNIDSQQSEVKTRRREFSERRFEYYAGGRLLFLQGSFGASATLLAYAIEYSLKAAMLEVRSVWSAQERELVERKHDLRRLYETCLRHGLLSKSYISSDFLSYAQDHFERRYPKSESKLLENRKYWSFGGPKLFTYDDCITQLDIALAELYGTPEFTIGAQAARRSFVSPPLFCALFQGNIFALENLETYRDAISSERLLNAGPEILRDPDALFSGEGWSGITIQLARELLCENLAALFVYPSYGQPDPDPANLLMVRQEHRMFGLNYSRWVIERLVREFGRHGVAVVESRDTRQVIAYAFNRRAKNWRCELILREGHHEFFVKNAKNIENLDAWVKKCKSQFTHLRKNLRLPSN